MVVEVKSAVRITPVDVEEAIKWCELNSNNPELKRHGVILLALSRGITVVGLSHSLIYYYSKAWRVASAMPISRLEVHAKGGKL